MEKEIPISIAKTLRKIGCKNFHFVSGFASHPDSIFFVPRVKGQCESALMGLGFEVLVIYRPGLLRLEKQIIKKINYKFTFNQVYLRCQREENRNGKSRRHMEKMARFISDWIDLGNWWSISTQNLAEFIVQKGLELEAESGNNKTIIFEHNDIVNGF